MNANSMVDHLTSERRFQLLIASVTDYAIYMLDPDGYVSSWNPGAQRLKGYLADEVIGQHFSVFYTEEERQAGVPERALRTARELGKFEAEGWRVRQDGTRFWASVVIDPVFDEAGEFIGFAKVTRDITERKQAAQALEQANAALFQSQKMEAIGQLTGGVAHDFNNLLGVLASSLDLLSMRLHDPADSRLLSTMQRAIDRGATLTQQLLSFARQQPLKIALVDPNQLIERFETMLRRAGRANITFALVLQERLKNVAVDVARFESALLNLVVNACHAMPDGGSVTIKTSNLTLPDHQIQQLPAGDYVRIDVIDTGSGMTPEVLARAFEPFFTTREIGKGTGLGLSQVHGFIAQSGGVVTLESLIGAGTTVSIYLPSLDAPVKAVEAIERESVLIVEDEADLMEVASELFRNMGYDVITASNGSDARDILERKTHVDIMFTDVMMPNGMNGIELARFAAQHYPTMKVILASGYTLPSLRTQYGDIDQFTFMSKPYRMAELAKTLRSD